MKGAFVVFSVLCGLAVADNSTELDYAIGSYQDVPVLPAVAPPVGDSEPQISNTNQTTTFNQTQVASDVVDAVNSNNSVVVATTVVVRDVVVKERQQVICTTRSTDAPSVTTPTDSPQAFQNYPPFAAAASAAAQDSALPSGYALVPDFVNLNVVVETTHYLGYTTQGLAAAGYDPQVCATRCNGIAGCTAFNIYYERDPLVVSDQTQVPDPVLCPGLATSPSATLLKCAFYGIPITAAEAINNGQFQGDFHVVVAGSNAYVKTSAPTIDGYEGPVPFPGGAINAPAPVIDHGYLRVQTFGQNVPFDPTLCATSCAAQTAYNAAHPDLGLGECVFFNVYVLTENGANGVLTCTYFSTPYGLSYATMPGQYDAAGDHYVVTNSYGYYLDGYFVE